MPGRKHTCSACSREFTRNSNLIRHQKDRCKALEKQKYSSYQQRVIENEQLSGSKKEEIPTFDSDEFSGKKPKSRETIYKMMKTMKIPEHRWGKIAADIVKPHKEPVDLSKFIDENDEEGSLTESEMEEFCEQFRTLYFSLIRGDRRENIDKLLDMLVVLLEAGEINRADYQPRSQAHVYF